MALKRDIKKYCDCGKQQAELLRDGRIRIFGRCQCKPKVPGPKDPPGRIVSLHSWNFIDNNPDKDYEAKCEEFV